MLTTIIKKLNLNSLRKLQLQKDFKRFGHTLSIKADEQIFGGIFDISTEGDMPVEGMYYIATLLKLYAAEHPDEEKFKDLAENIYQELYRNLDLDQALYLSIIKMEPMRFLKKLIAPLTSLFSKTFPDNYVYIQPVCREGHVFYTAFNQKYIAVCNRGQFEIPFLQGTGLFSAEKDKAHKLFHIYNDRLFSSYKSQYKAEEYITNLIDKKVKKVVEFKYNTQKVGTCSYANIKSLIKPILFMHSADPAALRYSDYIEQYKKFSSWVKTYEIKALLNKYIKARDEKDIAAAEVYRNLILTYGLRIFRADKNQKNLIILDIIYKYLQNDENGKLKELFGQIKIKYNLEERPFNINDLEPKNHINPPNFLIITKILPWFRLLVLLPLQAIFPIQVLIFIFAGLAVRALFTAASGNKQSLDGAENIVTHVSNPQPDNLLSSKNDFILSNIYSSHNAEKIKGRDSLHSISRNERNLNCYKYKY